MKALYGTKDCPSCGSMHKAKSFYVFENGWYCFSCHYTKASDRLPSVAKNATVQSEFKEYNEAERDPSKFSLKALQFLNNYYITAELIRHYGIRSNIDSVFYPIICSDEKVVGYQQRRLEKVNGCRLITGKGQKVPTLIRRM